MERGKYEPALKLFGKALYFGDKVKTTADLRIHFYIGEIYYRQSKFEESQGEFEKEIKLNPYYADARYNLGLIHEYLDKPKSALEEYRNAVYLDPTFKEAVEKLKKVR